MNSILYIDNLLPRTYGKGVYSSYCSNTAYQEEMIMTVDFVLRRPKVEKQTGLSRSTIYSLMQQGLFPKPISLGPRSKGWLQAEITTWLAERVRQRDEGQG